MSSEKERLDQAHLRISNWQRWGPYLAERQWSTVREDYSADGDCWDYFDFEQSGSRAYRWGEDGLLGIADRECRLCFAIALWNGRDPILKERLFGLTGHQGNHGEDVKELYYYLESSPTHSYMKALYKYPQTAFPYVDLIAENKRRTLKDPEYEILDTGVFNEDRYYDVFVEYAKKSPDDILIRITIVNRGPDLATLDLLPTLWFHNTWAWGSRTEGNAPRPCVATLSPYLIESDHQTLRRFRLAAEESRAPRLLFTENETNVERCFGVKSPERFFKDGIQEYVVKGRHEACNRDSFGTKAAFHYHLDFAPGEQIQVKLRLYASEEESNPIFGPEFETIFEDRIRELDEYYREILPMEFPVEEMNVYRQACAGLLWCKQFYHYVVSEWLDGDADQPPPPEEHRTGRNSDWRHLFNRDVISMPDSWEYPWYAAWDLAFHTVVFGEIDPAFAKSQLVLLLREWYMHPNGEIPAYEFDFGDVNPPVHAWACWQVYAIGMHRGDRDRVFLSRVFQKLLINFTWWVNRKDPMGNHLFSGGFLGLDNVGIFDRSNLPVASGYLEEADGTAWMAFYATTMLGIAMELSKDNPATEDIASKFFEHFVAIADAMNSLGGKGLWDDEDGFYYDVVRLEGQGTPLKVRSITGLIPLIAVSILHEDEINQLPGFKKRMMWFLENRRDLAQHVTYMERTLPHGEQVVHRLLAIPSKDRLVRCLRYMLDEAEFLSDFGIRSLSKIYEKPYVVRIESSDYEIQYVPGESNSPMFGGNSNWRGPIWFPLNFLIIEALDRYHHFYGDTVQVECPTGSGNMMNLREVADEISRRLVSIFLRGNDGIRPCHRNDPVYAASNHFRDLLLFYECFDGDTGRGVGASHQTGWTALVTRLIERVARARSGVPEEHI